MHPRWPRGAILPLIVRPKKGLHRNPAVEIVHTYVVGRYDADICTIGKEDLVTSWVGDTCMGDPYDDLRTHAG